MVSFNLVRWLKNWFRGRVTTIVKKRPRFRLRMEELETRLAPATFIWTGASGVDNNWSTATNWLGGVAPSASAATSAGLIDLTFDNRGAAHPISNNNLSGLNLDSITIAPTTGAAYTITGNAVTLGNPAVSSSGFINVQAPGATGTSAGFNNPSNTSPIVITSPNHGLVTGEVVQVSGVTGNTAANGIWTITVLTANTFSLNGSVTNGFSFGGGTWTAINDITMPIQLAGAGTSQQFVTVGSGSVLDLSGQMTGTTGSQLTKEGLGTLILTNNNSGYVGPFTVDHDAGAVQITNSASLGGATTSTVEKLVLTGAATTPLDTSFALSYGTGVGSTTGAIAYTGTTADAAAVQAALNGLTAINSSGGSVQVYQINTTGPNTEAFFITFTGTFAGTNVTQAVTASVTQGPGSFSSVFPSTTGGLPSPYVVTVGNNSELQLSNLSTGAITGATNPTTGPIVIKSVANGLSSGQVVSISGVLGNTAANGLFTITVVDANDFSLNGTVGNGVYTGGGVWSAAVANPLHLNGFGPGNLGALLNVAGNNIWSGSVTFDSDTYIGGSVSGGTLTINGSIGDSAVANVTKVGVGTLIFANADTYRGSTTIENGILRIENPFALGSVGSAGTFETFNTVTGDQGTLQIAYVGGTTVPTNTTDFLLQNPALPYNATTNPYVGFLVPNYQLFLDGRGFNNEALDNFEGNNAWSGSVTLGATSGSTTVNVNIGVDAFAGVNTTLTISGVIGESAARAAIVGSPLEKVAPGNLILVPTDPVTGLGTPNTYPDPTLIFTGTLTIEDSQALGPITKPTSGMATVDAGAALDLESNVGHIDSVTGTTGRSDGVHAALTLNGTGPAQHGREALRGVSAALQHLHRHGAERQPHYQACHECGHRRRSRAGANRQRQLLHQRLQLDDQRRHQRRLHPHQGGRRTAHSSQLQPELHRQR